MFSSLALRSDVTKRVPYGTHFVTVRVCLQENLRAINVQNGVNERQMQVDESGGCATLTTRHVTNSVPYGTEFVT